MKVIYKAEGLVTGSFREIPPIQVRASSYKELRQKMEDEARKYHYALNMENSRSGWNLADRAGEPWVKQLVMPRVHWEVEKNIIESDDV